MPVHFRVRSLNSALPLVLFVGALFPCTTLAAPSITLSKKIGPPTSKILVSGSGFEANVGVDIYFDIKDEGLVVTNNEGEFHNAKIHAPREARPGEHWVTALERNNDKGDQEPFVVNTDWDQFDFDIEGTRFNPYENVLNSKNAGTLIARWTAPSRDAFSSPAFVKGVVYEGVGQGFSAFDAITGMQCWTFQTPAAIYSSPAVVDDVIYFGTDDGNFYALKAGDGALLWSYMAPGSVRSSPIVSGGTVYFGSENGAFFALNANTGARLWQFLTGNNYSIESAPAIVNGTVYFGSDDDNVYALDASTGVMLWKYATSGYVQSGPAVSNGAVYFGSDDQRFYALNANTGSFLWSFQTQQLVFSSPAIASGVVYLAAWDQHVYALDAATGALLWKVAVAAPSGSPALANGVLYVPSGAVPVSLQALDAHTGANLWTYALDGNVASSPAVANGMVFFSSQFTLYAFGLPEGDSAKTSISGPPDLKSMHSDRTLRPSMAVAAPDE